MPGFQSFFSFLHHFVLPKLAKSSNDILPSNTLFRFSFMKLNSIQTTFFKGDIKYVGVKFIQV